MAFLVLAENKKKTKQNKLKGIVKKNLKIEKTRRKIKKDNIP